MAVVAVAFAGGQTANGAQVLSNGQFESWPIAPRPWVVASGTASEASSPSVSGSSALIEGSQPGLQQRVAAAGGGEYRAGISVRSAGSANFGTLVLQFASSDGQILLEQPNTVTVGTGGFTRIEVTSDAPPGTATVTFQLQLDGEAYVDAASLDEQTPPTATPAPTDTPTNTPAPAATATPTQAAAPTSTPAGPAPTQPPSSATQAPTSPSGAATATPTPIPTSPPTQTPSPIRPGGGIADPTSAPAPTETPHPTETPPPTEAPPPPAGPSIGGLLSNPGFEYGSGNAPSGWSKYGGTLGRSQNAKDGSWAATLLSTTSSTKWVHQVVPVDGGSWYAASGWGRRSSGSCEMFLRLSWYSSHTGSGRTMHQDDSGTTQSPRWTSMATGSVQAPESANSVRVRLMVRPDAPCSAAFDSILLRESMAPTATPVPPSTATAIPSSPGSPGGDTDEPTATSTSTSSSTSTPTPTPRDGESLETRTPPPAADRGNNDEPDDDATPGGDVPDGSGSGDTSDDGPIFAGEAAAEGRSLVLSEVMSDPDTEGNDNEHEWVEVHNVGDEAVDLHGWMISDAVATDRLSTAVIPGDGYGIIAGELAEVPGGVPFVRVPDGRIGRGLNNGGDTIVLVDPDGEIIDGMSYGGDDTYEDGPAAPGAGETIARRIQGDGSWTASLEPTLGEANLFPDEPTPEAGETPVENPTEAGRTREANGGDDDVPGGTPGSEGEGDTGAVLGEGEGEEADIQMLDNEPNIVPWVVLAAAAGAGLMAASGYAPKAARLLRERYRNGR